MGLLNKRVIILLGCLCFTYLLFFKPTPITPVNDINLPFKRIKTQNCKPLPNYPDIQYAVIIDAGSTGSRIHVYRFNYCNQSPKLEDEVFVITKPGLSSYVHDPQAAADSLDKLLKAAVENVPKELYGCTPIALKATAGLRMLKDGMGDEILKAVEKKLRREYPFPVFKNDGVAIMGGDDEGVFAWITLNYLLGNIGQTDRKETAGVLDLGGGSTQIVFEPKNYELPTGGHRVDLEFSNHKYTLYQHSYDGYGLMQGRLKIKKAAKTTFKVPCLPDGQITHFEDDGVITKMTGTATDYGQCHNFITQNLFSQTQCSLNPCSFDGIYMPDIVT
ncbi:nucleoside phosphatase GDA1/CD39, partial [Globomyces pollinis-pini]